MKIGFIKKAQSATKTVARKKEDAVQIKLRVPPDFYKRLIELKWWYRKNLNLKVTVAFLARDFISDGLDRENNLARKAELGRYHAKIRKMTSSKI